MKVGSIVVIGHVDHGKTALVRALTGIETDRLKEEKARGLSIALGFAYCDYPSGGADFIDAPGHADFIRAMISGATGAQSALLVISATEGAGRQTREHLQIANLLGIRTGVIAVTKADLLPESERPARRDEILAALAGAGLDGAPLVFCSAVTQEGLAALNDALEALVTEQSIAAGPAGFCLPVDRAFNVQGLGTVVTGTLLGASIKAGEEAVIYPQCRPVTVRGVQTRGAQCGEVQAGRRCAVNLRGVSLDEIRPGDVLGAAGAFAPSTRFDVEVNLAADCGRPLKRMDEVRVMFGTRAEIASVRPLGAAQISPGERRFAQLRFRSAVTGYAGQRAILRALSPAATIGGAMVLDPAPSVARGDQTVRIAALDAAGRGDMGGIALALSQLGRGIALVEDVARLSRRRDSDVGALLAMDFDDLGEGMLAHRVTLEDAQDAYLGRVEAFHERTPLKTRMPVRDVIRDLRGRYDPALLGHVEAGFQAAGVLVFSGDGVACVGRDPIAGLNSNQRRVLWEIESALRVGGLTPPDPAELWALGADGADLLELLVESGKAVSLYNHALRRSVLFHAEALKDGLLLLRDRLPAPVAFRTGEARLALDTSRKFIVPLLEHFDVCGWTVRDGDLRTLSPLAMRFTRVMPGL